MRAPTMRWKCISVAFSLREPSKASAIRLRALACSARIASYSGTMRPKAVATFWATPSWGQSWRAISKVRAWRVSRLGEDLERLEAILENLLLAPGAHRQRVPLGAAQKSPARAACTRRAGAQRRTAKGGEFASRGIRLWPKGKFVDRSRCRPNGLGLRPRITEGDELAVGSSCGPLLARDKRISEMARALNPRRPSPRSGSASAARS